MANVNGARPTACILLLLRIPCRHRSSKGIDSSSTNMVAAAEAEFVFNVRAFVAAAAAATVEPLVVRWGDQELS